MPPCEPEEDPLPEASELYWQRVWPRCRVFTFGMNREGCRVMAEHDVEFPETSKGAEEVELPEGGHGSDFVVDLPEVTLFGKVPLESIGGQSAFRTCCTLSVTGGAKL